MNKFTTFIGEDRKNYDSISLLKSEITNYINKVKKSLPKKVKDTIYLTQKYNILDSESLIEIKTASKKDIKELVVKYGLKDTELLDLQAMLKSLKSDINMLPQFMSPQQRKAIEAGKMAINDLTIDLDSPEGRNAAAKMYMPMVLKIVDQWVGKSNLNRNDLISVALEGFTEAMNTWRGKKDDNNTSFKTYAGYKVKYAILNEINNHGHTLSGGNSYLFNKYGAGMLDAVSLDGLFGTDDREVVLDRVASLGELDNNYKLTNDEIKSWKELYNIIDNKFKQIQSTTFYRFFGLNGYKKEKSKDIAKSIGKSEPYIRNNCINPILAFLKKDRKSFEIVQNLQDIYTESLMVELLGRSKEMILEALTNDDVYILLEDLNRWGNKNVFVYTINSIFDKMNKSDKNIIVDILANDFEYLDDVFKKYKKLIILFLSNIYPTENMSRKSDVDILEYMQELQEYYQLYKL